MPGRPEEWGEIAQAALDRARDLAATAEHGLRVTATYGPRYAVEHLAVAEEALAALDELRATLRSIRNEVLAADAREA